MIITEKKSFSKILNMLEGIENVFIIGCGDCATLSSTGGEAEVEDMRLKLEKEGKNVTGFAIPKTPCHVPQVRRELQISKQEINDAQAVLVLSCGSGVQSVSEILANKAVLPGLNTMFLGNIKRFGWFDERCSMCGDCILDKTMGICPVTRCAKSLVNGPCGGSVNGKCEVGGGDHECAWSLIYERFRKADQVVLLEKYQPMKDFEVAIKPAVVDIRQETQDQRADRMQLFKEQKLEIRRKFERATAKAGIKESDPPSGNGGPVTRLQRELETGNFVATCEIIPPKGVRVDEALEHARSLKDYVTAYCINENPGSIMRLASLSMGTLFAREGMEPIIHLTTRERNRLALQSELLGAHVLGIHNVLAMTGDHQSVGDHREAKPVYDLDSVQLIRLARELTRGRDYSGNPLDGSPRFFLGGVVCPGSDMLPIEVVKLKKKVDAGASFFLTQAIFDVELLKRFVDEVRKTGVNPYIIAGIIPLKSKKMADYMNAKIPGIFVPEKLIERIDAKKDKKAVSLEIAREIVEASRPLVHGIHLMPIGWYDLVPALVGDFVQA